MTANAPGAALNLPPELPAGLEALVLPVDKPSGWSSFDVIRRLRRILRVRKIGHAGTLDPMATGLLICLVGRATKQMEHYMHQPKQYEGTLRLGQETGSYDAESDVIRERPWEHVQDDLIATSAQRFVGEIEQLPPMYSAVKVGGERLYRKARRGEEVDRPARNVRVDEFRIDARRGRDVDFYVACSKGTYVRTLAHDLGEALGTGAHLVALRRTAIGDVRVENAWTIDALERAGERLRREEEA